MTMDALAYDKEYRSLFEEMVNAILDERNLIKLFNNKWRKYSRNHSLIIGIDH